MEFASEGFDLDALPAASQDVVYEIGGGVSRIELESPPAKEEEPKPNDDDTEIMKVAEDWKQQGNRAFQEHNWLEAYDMYTEAIQATPGPLTGEQLLEERNAWRKKEHERARRALAEQENARRQKEQEERKQKRKDSNDKETTPSSETTTHSSSQEEESADNTNSQKEPLAFEPPPHPHGVKLSIYHCNRSAALLHLERYTEAISDCDVALLWNPTYVKAFVRRAKALEAQEQYEAAMADIQKAQQLDITASPQNQRQYRTTLQRLEKLEHDRMETLKTETMGKLKDLGNSILGNFGLSMDNFKAVQDPNTGSYSISFDQNNNNGGGSQT